MNTEEQIKKLEKLMLSEDLEELNLSTNKFNIFTALKLHNNEIRHSNFLGWLMAPYENHGVGDYFLKEFLKEALKECSLNENIKASLSDVIFNDFSDTEIRREYKNIDILIVSPKNKFVCVVENKIWSGEHSEQLQKYAKIVNSEFKDYDKKIGIFLTPNPNLELEDNILIREKDGERYYYIQMDYEQIYDVINRTLKFKASYMNDEVKIFINHYQKMLERNIMSNEDSRIISLCRRIYRENKEAIDLINKYANSSANNIAESLYNIVLKNSDLVATGFHNAEYTEFFQKEIADKMQYGEKHDKLCVYYLFLQRNNAINFILWISRSDISSRQAIYDILKNNLNDIKDAGMSLNDFTGKKVEQMIIVPFIQKEEYANFEDMNTIELEQELTKRFKAIYNGKIKVLMQIFRNNIQNIPEQK